jgi:hypothetical protein
MSRTALLHSLLAQRILVLDGAMGTMIQTYKLTEADYRGERFADFAHDLKGNNDLLCLTQPHIIRELHDKYLAAGADILETNSFNATSISMADYHMEHLVPELNLTAARLAREAADALGELGTPAARDALLHALPDASAVVREEIAGALGKFALDDGAVAALDKLIKRDRSPSVVAAALDGLAEARPSVARQDALNVLGAGDDSMQGARHAAALDVLGDHGKPGDATTVLRFTSDKLAGVQRRAGSALVALAKLDEAPKSAKDDAAKALLPWLHHDDMRTRQAGISLLARLGSDAALPALRATAATTTVAELRDSLYAAITSIRSANGDKSDPDALVAATAKLEEMEKKIEELEARVGKVEAQ